MRKKKFNKRLEQLSAAVRRAREEADCGRFLETGQLLQDELIPRSMVILKELEPFIAAWKAQNEALEGSMKPLVMECEEENSCL